MAGVHVSASGSRGFGCSGHGAVAEGTLAPHHAALKSTPLIASSPGMSVGLAALAAVSLPFRFMVDGSVMGERCFALGLASLSAAEPVLATVIEGVVSWSNRFDGGSQRTWRKGARGTRSGRKLSCRRVFRGCFAVVAVT
jgi:hypothetical protein